MPACLCRLCGELIKLSIGIVNTFIDIITLMLICLHCMLQCCILGDVLVEVGSVLSK